MKYLKIITGVAGGLAVLLGSVWVLQGINLLPGSFMTGDIQWAYRGGALAAAGVGVILLSLRKPRRVG